jgi:hypothetical protein
MLKIEDDLFPIGEFESIPVSINKTNSCTSFPNVIKLNYLLDSNQLYQEYLEFKKQLKFISPSRFIKERLRHIKLDQTDWSNYFNKLGFNDQTYETYSMRILGTNKFKPEIGEYTRQKISYILGIETFRQQYAIAHAGWKTEIHVDTIYPNIHGFRVMIPLNAQFNIGFEDDKIYTLEPGDAYFINVSNRHYGLNPLDISRCCIMLQLSSDKFL